MILRLLLLFISLILLGSCDKVIHKNGARAQNALDSMIEQYSYPENDNFTSKRVNNKEDIIGNWVGSFNVPQLYMNAYIFDDGRQPWHIEDKINISIQHIEENRVDGISIIAGTVRPLKGTIQETENGFEIILVEPGREQYDGTYHLFLDSRTSMIRGTWLAYKDIVLKERNLSLKKRFFNYNPIIPMERVSIRNDISLFRNIRMRSEYRELYHAIKSHSQQVYEINPSISIIDPYEAESLSGNDLMLLRNIIFAKHGYAFKKRPLRIYFESQPWYIPVSTNVKNELTYIEKENIKTILRYEKYNEYHSDY